MSSKNKQINNLVLYRERMGFTQQHVATLLGTGNSSLLSKFEQGHRLPSFVTALKLAIIYRVPVDFLYSELYAEIRKTTREREEKLAKQNPQLPLS